MQDRAPDVSNIHTTFGEDGTCSTGDMLADRQTGKQTDTVITILRGRRNELESRRRWIPIITHNCNTATTPYFCCGYADHFKSVGLSGTLTPPEAGTDNQENDFVRTNAKIHLLANYLLQRAAAVLRRNAVPWCKTPA